MARSSISTARAEQISWLLAAGALIAILKLHLLSALFAALLVYELVHVLAPLLQRRISSERSRMAAVAILTTLVVSVVALAVFGAIAFFRSDIGNLAGLLKRMADIIEGARDSMPAWVVEKLPEDADQLRQALAAWLRSHSPQLQLMGTTAGRVMLHILIGMIIGAMVALSGASRPFPRGALAIAMTERALRLGESFRQVVFAQGKIAAINTVLTALYLAVLLPLFGVKLPLVPALIGVTLIAGLLPVVGNLISNTIIVVVSLAHSPQMALVSLAFLITVHKMEYFLNARIIGTRINARAWELLIAMLVMEAGFGIAGAVAAPVYYAYLKQELADCGLI
jgi:predicted PurR-regulated permease PerM